MQEAYAMASAPGGQPGSGGALGGFVPLIFIFVIFYFLLIRPQQKKAKEQKKTLDNLKRGDKVVTTGGMHGEVVGIKEGLVEIEVAEGVRITFSKEAISYVKKV